VSRAGRDPLTEKVIGIAIGIHRSLGPGLLESAYEECFCYDLVEAGIAFRRQVALPVVYKAVNLDCAYRMDVVVEDSLVIELKAVEAVTKLHQAQMLTYLKISGIRTGLLINFNVPVLIDGVHRLVR
jgi:GxxExxY protein